MQLRKIISLSALSLVCWVSAAPIHFSVYNNSKAAVQSSGKLWIWGSNETGQLGLGDFEYRATTTPLHDGEWSQVAMGNGFAVAIAADSSLWSWGKNDVGQLGNGSFDNISTPKSIMSGKWIAVSAGFDHAVAINQDGTLWAWGNNNANGIGYFGNGSNTGSNTPQLVSNEQWLAVTAGGKQTHAIKADSTLWFVGYNVSGQAGNGTATSSMGWKSTFEQSGTAKWKKS